jgi:hypothetical protein
MERGLGGSVLRFLHCFPLFPMDRYPHVSNVGRQRRITFLGSTKSCHLLANAFRHSRVVGVSAMEVQLESLFFVGVSVREVQLESLFF